MLATLPTSVNFGVWHWQLFVEQSNYIMNTGFVNVKLQAASGDAGVPITSGNSIASYDTAGTTISGGRHIFSVALDNPNSSFVDLSPYEIFLAPTGTLTISGFSTVASTIAVGVHWSEDI